MTLTCADCTTAYAVGLRACPHCRSTRIVREDNGMAKITVHGGATNAAETEQGVPSSAGTSSSPSPENSPTKPRPSAPGRRSRARTTANRSKTDPTASSSAPSTDGGQTEPTSADPADE